MGHLLRVISQSDHSMYKMFFPFFYILGTISSLPKTRFGG